MADATQTDGTAAPTEAPATVVADVVPDPSGEIEGLVSLDDEPTSEDVADESQQEETQDAATGEEDTEQAETGDLDGEETADEETDEAGEEMLSFDFGGNKLEVPAAAVTPELAEKIDEFTKGTWATFTRGQQENVERSKTLDAREETVAKLQALNGEALQTYSYGLHLRSEIEQLAQVDLDALWQSEPDRARQISDLLGAKQAEFQTVIAQVGEHERAFEEKRTEAVARQREQGEAYLNRHIKNFSTEKADTLVKYVMDTYGMPKEQADQWALNPVVTRMAYKAMLFDRQASRAKAPAPKPRQTAPVRAEATTGASTPATRDPEEMSFGELSKHLGIVNAA